MKTQQELLERAEGVKFKKLAEVAGVSVQTVYNWHKMGDDASRMFVEHAVKIHDFLISIGK